MHTKFSLYPICKRYNIRIDFTLCIESSICVYVCLLGTATQVIIECKLGITHSNKKMNREVVDLANGTKLRSIRTFKYNE